MSAGSVGFEQWDQGLGGTPVPNYGACERTLQRLLPHGRLDCLPHRGRDVIWVEGPEDLRVSSRLGQRRSAKSGIC